MVLIWQIGPKHNLCCVLRDVCFGNSVFVILFLGSLAWFCKLTQAEIISKNYQFCGVHVIHENNEILCPLKICTSMCVWFVCI